MRSIQAAKKGPDIICWSFIIRDQARNGLWAEALNSYRQMCRSSSSPNNFSFCAALKACADSQTLQLGKCIHSHVLKHGFQSHTFVANSLISMYASCQDLESALQAFQKMQKRDCVSWNSIISGFSRNGYYLKALEFFARMRKSLGDDVGPSATAVVCALNACGRLGDLEKGLQIHYYARNCGFMDNVFVGNALIDMYSKCCRVKSAIEVFERMREKNLVSWTSMINGLVNNGLANEAIKVFVRMLDSEIRPNSVTIASVFQACGMLGNLHHGRQIHCYVICCGLQTDLCLENSLIDMYAKCESFDCATRAFRMMPARDVVSWNSLIGGFSAKGFADECFGLFKQMIAENIQPCRITMGSMLQACARGGNLLLGKCAHGRLIRSGFHFNEFVLNSLIDMYGKCGCLDSARQVFDEVPKGNSVTWNALISGYVSNGNAEEALSLFQDMQEFRVKPDSVTMLCMLQASVLLKALKLGKWFHDYIVSHHDSVSNITVQNALIDMYAKCGDTENARKIFYGLVNKDVTTWSTMISAYGMQGDSEEALRLFDEMLQENVKPNHITLVAVLHACSHAGLVTKGLEHFSQMIKSHAMTPVMEHYACVVDMLGRSGLLDEADKFIQEMPVEAGASVWAALLSASKTHRRNMEERAKTKLVDAAQNNDFLPENSFK